MQSSRAERTGKNLTRLSNQHNVRLSQPVLARALFLKNPGPAHLTSLNDFDPSGEC